MNENIRWKGSHTVILLAIVLIGIGVYRGEAGEVLSKGINLCLECVGIG